MRTATLSLVLLALAAPVFADEKLATDFLRRHPELKGFDPAREALNREVKAGELKPRDARRMLAAARAAVPQRQRPQPVYTTEQLTVRQARMARAARRRAMLAQIDAANARAEAVAVSAFMANVRASIPHY